MTLGVLESTLAVINAARSVALDQTAIAGVAEQLAARPFRRPEWRVFPHWWDDSERTAQYVFVLDALNFCFWGEPKWQVEYRGRSWDGYWALAACLRGAIEAGRPILDANYLARIDQDATAELLQGQGRLPLLAERAESLRELGAALLQRYHGQAHRMVASAEGSAVALARRVADELPSFRDTASYDGRTVRFYKRAQILCGDLHGAYAGLGPGSFHDLDQLTAFADYKLPQVLRELGVLVYQPELAAKVDHFVELAPGSREELEIRAATVWAVESIRRSVLERAIYLKAFEIDWYLWELGQQGTWELPYHRTKTIFY